MNIEKKISADDYGFILTSINEFNSFILQNTKSNKISNFFQKNHNVFEEGIAKGVFLPINQISSCEYSILTNYDMDIDDLKSIWEIIEFKEIFILEIGKENSLWVIAISQLNNWNIDKFTNENETIGYWIENGTVGENFFIPVGQRITIPQGKYEINVLGLKRKEKYNDDDKDYGYFFNFKKVASFKNNFIVNEFIPDFDIVD